MTAGSVEGLEPEAESRRVMVRCGMIYKHRAHAKARDSMIWRLISAPYEATRDQRRRLVDFSFSTQY